MLISDQLALAIAEIAHRAGAPIMEIYRGAIAVAEKADNSPVTLADQAAEKIILAALSKLLPNIPVLAEESADLGQVFDEDFILVDPLDGTKEFIQKRDDFTVNIALIAQGAPILGSVYAPARQMLYWGARGLGAWRLPIAADDPFDAAGKVAIETRAYPTAGLTAISSRSHADAETAAFLARLPIAGAANAGSSLKFCLVAAGEADVYPRFGPTMEWDIAAGQAVLEAAGGAVLAADGGPMRFGKAADRYRNGAFIAWGKTAITP